MNQKFNINDEIKIDITNEISVSDLVYSLDKSKAFKIFEINEDDFVETGEKNYLINIQK